MSAADAVATAPQFTAAERRAVEHKYIRSKYSDHQRDAALHLYSLVRRCRDTGGGIRATKFLLSLYNGRRFQFDLTDMRCFDDGALRAALVVLEMDARRTYCEIHTLLNAILGEGANTGAEFEHWAYDLRLAGRCKKDQLPDLPNPLPFLCKS